MKQFRTVLVLGFSPAVAVLPLSPPLFIPEIPLKCTLQPADGRRIHLQLMGTAAVPDGTILSLRLQRLQEAQELGDRMAPSLYRQLLRDYPDEVDSLGARLRMVHRARSE